MENYNFKLTEQKWQEYWSKNNSFYFDKNDKREKFYVLQMFPYPSGELHIGHLRNFVIGDIISRFKRMQGFNVLHPMGADAFGLPAENAAIKRKINPEEWTKNNIEIFKQSMKRLGLSFDFSRYITTCFPEYYGKQQKLFIDLFKNDLCYQKESFVNWDPVDQTVLANEQVVNGRGWRSGALVERKKIRQWFFKITKYAEELLNDIDDKLQEWPEKVRLMQKNWIGKSEGATVKFKIKNENVISSHCKIPDFLEVYTTRPDTLFGASFIGISSNHQITEELAKNNVELDNFVKECQKISMDENTIETMEKKGFFTGLYVEHPFDNELKLPIYIANFILMDYGTGAIFACPAHDKRDYEFATKYNLPIKVVVSPDGNDFQLNNSPFEEDGIAINSNFLNGLNTKDAKKVAIDKIEELKIGERKINYRLRDWGFSRQRYWGCPIPIVYCEKCGTVHLKEEDLPLELPKDVEFTSKGNPLDNSNWKYTKCPKCGGDAIRETDTMDTFVDSSWYFLRYPELTDDRPFNSELCEKLFPVDQYIGGIEHATMHLIYCRFFTKALRDCGYFKIDEPVKKLFNQGMLCHKAYRGKITKDWCYPENVIEKDNKYYNLETNEELDFEGIIKMSKSKSNVINNMKIVNAYGADSARMFVMSDSPANKDFEWTEQGIDGCWKYINKFYKICSCFEYKNLDISNINYNNIIIKNTHKLIKDITINYDNIEFNKAIARVREFTNFLEKVKINTEEEKKSYLFALITVVKLFSPITPHLCAELLDILDCKNNDWPVYDESLTIDNVVNIAVAVNGKLRATIEVSKDIDKIELEELAKQNDNIKKYIDGVNIKKVIVVENKMINFVI